MLAIFAVISILGCGPELTTPAATDVTGRWYAAGPAEGLSDITLTLVQGEAGRVTGTFTATGTPGTQQCPATGRCDLASTIEGANTVLQLSLELKDAASFTGQVDAPNRLRGALTRQGNSLVEFSRIQ